MDDTFYYYTIYLIQSYSLKLLLLKINKKKTAF